MSSIRFACPSCGCQLEVPAERSGTKTDCPGCGQRLLIPPPARGKTVLAQPLPLGAADKPPAVLVLCPGCGRKVPVPPDQLDSLIECARCETQFVPTAPAAPPRRTPEPEEEPAEAGHSNLGIASFIIAVLIGGLDLMLAVIISTAIAKAGSKVEMATAGVGGVTSLLCLNVLSVPLCLVGVAMGFVALIAHRDRNHVFTWLGVLGNAAVICSVMGFYLFVQLHR